MASGTCSECGYGTYKDTTGAASCTTCTGVSTGQVTTLSTASTSSAACLCQAGYSGPDLTCPACALGTYKSTLDMSTCTSCPTGATTMTTASTALTDCVCQPGYIGGKGGPCSQCFMGTYSLGGITSTCTACPAGRYGDVNGLSVATCSGLCSAGYWCPIGSRNSTARACPTGTTSNEGASAQTGCSICVAGNRLPRPSCE